MKLLKITALTALFPLFAFGQTLPTQHLLEDGPLDYDFVTYLKGTEV